MISRLPAAADAVFAIARSALSNSAISQLRRLEVEKEDERIVIRGRVSSFYHKQLAQELIRCKLPDVQVVNEILVESRMT